MAHCKTTRFARSWMMGICLAFVTLCAGGCLQLTATHPPFAPKRLPDITFHVRIPSANFAERLNISATGDIYAQSSERGIANGMLSDTQVAELQKAFAGWDELPATYSSDPDGPIYIVVYAAHAVTGGSLTAAPPLFQQAVGELRKVMDGLRWESASGSGRQTVGSGQWAVGSGQWAVGGEEKRLEFDIHFYCLAPSLLQPSISSAVSASLR